MATSHPPGADLAGAPVHLRAGPLDGTVELGALRWLRVGDREVVRGVYMAVRDPDWGTVQPEFTRYQIQTGEDGFRVELEARNVAPGIDFRWFGTIEGSATCWRYTFEGEPKVPFWTARIGLCLLHPPSDAGRIVRVNTPWGQLNGRFPTEIAPMSLFGAFDRLTQPLGRGQLSISFEGDLFEMEDQRNWTDASFKTYSTPLQFPCPRIVEPGQVVRQTVTIAVRGAPKIAHRIARTAASFERGTSGRLPPIGIVSSSEDISGPVERVDMLRLIRPAHLRVALDPQGPNVLARVVAAAAESRALGAPLELELIVPDDAVELGPLLALVVAAKANVVRVLAFDRRTFVTTRRVAQAARDLLNNAGLDVPLGGGSRADFYELNLTSLPHVPQLPLDLLQLISFRITPQVHAFDDATIIENLEGVRAAIRSARAVGHDKPVAIGPATLLPLFNPSAMDAAGSGPARVPDRRQSTPFAAAWTVGLVQVAVEEGLSSLTCHETVGAAGIISADGPRAIAFPVAAALAALAGRAGQLTRCIAGPGQLAGVEVGTGRETRAIVANLSQSPLLATLAGPPTGAATVLAGTAEVSGRQGHRSLALGPYGVMMLEPK